MSELFLTILNLSITASWLILAILFLRLVMRKAPKWIICALWTLVAIRLLSPFCMESRLSLIPSSEPIPKEIVLNQVPSVNSEISVINQVINPIMVNVVEENAAGINPLQMIVTGAAYIWLAGMIGMFGYALFSYFQLKRTTGAFITIERNIRACDEVKSPFILGVFRPIIYVPSAMNGETLDYVLTHEKAHLRRGDHLWKPFGYVLLSVYWFNPLCWVAYVLLCRDIEMACDEKVVRDLDHDGKVAYSQILLNCHLSRKRIAACPLAFGEVGVKERVKSILYYKKPAVWILLFAAVMIAVISICFMTNPKREEDTETAAAAEETDQDGESATQTGENLPPYRYNNAGEDKAQEEAIYEYILKQTNPYAYNQVVIPAFVIFQSEMASDGRIKIHGDFWTYTYVKNGDVLECLGGGKETGVYYLRKTQDGSYVVDEFDRVGDGSYFTEDVKRISEGNKELEQKYYDSADDMKNPAKNIRARVIEQYILDNALEITSYQDAERQPVSVDDRRNPMVMGDVFTEPVNTLDGVTLSLEKYKAWEGELLIKNDSGRELEIGENFEIHVKKDGNWYCIEPFDEMIWHQIAYEIPNGKTTAFVINWLYVYGILQEGDYRIVKEVTQYRAPGDYDVYYLASEFSIKE